MAFGPPVSYLDPRVAVLHHSYNEVLLDSHNIIGIQRRDGYMAFSISPELQSHFFYFYFNITRLAFKKA